MAQYLLTVHYVDGQGGTQRTIEESAPADPEAEMQKVFERVERFNQKLQSEGNWVFAGGLQTPDTASVVDASTAGTPLITDGPFSEAKEQIGGFWVIEAADLDEARRIATEGSIACAAPVEIRPFQGA